ncbi:MAG: phosphate acyltransferase PlsX [Brevinematales bacterium]|nr:phosphate acyltransferase PlsX [Brevinematales bacterium]
MVYIAVDVMGTERGVGEAVKGCIKASLSKDIAVVMVGKEDLIKENLKKYSKRLLKKAKFDIVNATEVIEMTDEPFMASRKKKDSSIMVALSLLKDGKVDGFFSPGNTGAVVISSVLKLGRIDGVSKPGLATVIPSMYGFRVLLDVGASIDLEPRDYVILGAMGKVFVENVLKIYSPKIGLLNIGEEDYKGTEVVKKARELMMQKLGQDFIGNVEGNDIFLGDVDVIVTDGFTGNIVLKSSEGASKALSRLMKQEIMSKWYGFILGALMKVALKKFKRKTDASEYGAAALLGVNGNVFIGHGASNAKSIKSGIFYSAYTSKLNLQEKIQKIIRDIGEM